MPIGTYAASMALARSRRPASSAKSGADGPTWKIEEAGSIPRGRSGGAIISPGDPGSWGTSGLCPRA